MKRDAIAGLIALLLATVVVAAQGGGQGGRAQGEGRGNAQGGGRGNEPPPINYNTKMPWSSWEAGVNTWWANFPREAQGVEPFKIFDNLYYVGIQTGQALLIPTTDGLILIDATWAETADLVLNSIRKAGFDPANIKYILISHGHGRTEVAAAVGSRQWQ